MKRFEDRTFLGFLAIASLAMAWIVFPFFGAILWGIIAAILFTPVNRWIVGRMPQYRNTAALLTMLLIIAIVIIPAFMIGTLLVDEALTTYQGLQSREIDFAKLVSDVEKGLPDFLRDWLRRSGLDDLKGFQDRISSVVTTVLRMIAAQAVSIGQGALSFAMAMGIMLYLTFFLLRDGRHLQRRISNAIPLAKSTKTALFEKFATVIRATIKGSIVVALVQGMLGGIVFAFLDIRAPILWGVVMGVLSLVPAIGTGLIWVPVAIYLFATGAIWQGVVLVLCGVFLIGMVDNVLRPILVGKDTRMPDYVVLISTLGGISVLGVNGFIIGPVIAALFIAAWGIFADSREDNAELEARQKEPKAS